MANTTVNHKAMLAAMGIEPQLVIINIPNKIAKRMRSGIKKRKGTSHWDMLRIFHPARFISLMRQLKNK